MKHLTQILISKDPYKILILNQFSYPIKDSSISKNPIMLLFLIQPKIFPSRSALTPVGKNRKSKGNEEITPLELLPPRILQQIQWNGGTLPIFLFQKRLTNSDVKPNQNRLFLSRRDKPEKLMEFLTDVERNQVDSDIDGVEVLTIDPKGDYHTLNLKRWHSIPMVVLKSQWKKLVSDNQLKEDDWIQLWGYRENSQFHLAFNIKKAEKNLTQGDGASSSDGGNNLDGSNSSSKGNSCDGSGSGASIISVA
ncbi:Uncharacterized protein Fot_50424 [Forsythia ovata]|uniref:TF-B3 domain-containing protein n=1 Tax=Forsythia ovata TaxID=205694 RepID=A0ABD1PZP6_9LAMI